MKIKNLLWAGCSFSAGSAFTSKPSWHSNVIDEPFIFAHDGLKKYFKEPFTNKNIKNQIREITFPVQLGNKMKCNIIKNFSVGGMGYPINTRKLFSYLINNPDNIEFKETVIGIQLTSFQRDELLKTHPNGDIEFAYLDGESHENHAKQYITNYWNPVYSVIKSLYDLNVFKGWCESKGIKIHFFGFYGFVYQQILIYRAKYDKMITQVNLHELTHDNINFPSINTLIRNLEIIELDELNFGTFHTDGYHNDTHLSPNGHSMVADNLFNIFTKQLKYEI